MFIEERENKSLNDFMKLKFNRAAVSQDGMINSFLPVNDEYESLKHGVAIRPLLDTTVLEFVGNETADLLNRISTNDLKIVGENEKTFTLFLNTKGKIVDRTLFLKIDGHTFLACNKNRKEILQNWIEQYIIDEDIKIAENLNEYSQFEIIGPQADSYLTMICGKMIEELNETNIINCNYYDTDFYITKYIEQKTIQKYLIFVKSDFAGKLLSDLLSFSSVFDLNICGYEAYNIFRIEMGITDVPNEINDNYTPFEVNLLDNISFMKKNFIGHQTIKKSDFHGQHQRELIGVFLNVDFDYITPLKIFNSADENIGMLTSVAYSKYFKKTIGLAVVDSTAVKNDVPIYTKYNKMNIDLFLEKVPFTK